MAKKPLAYPPANQRIEITPAEWTSWIAELPNITDGEPAPYNDHQAFHSDDLPVIPPIIGEAHQGPQNVITAETLKRAESNSALTHLDLIENGADFDLPLDPEVDQNYNSLTKATSGPKHLERALYGQVNPLLVAEYVFAIADEPTLASAYGMTVPELRKTITSQPFQTAADSLRKAWETNPQLDTQYRAKQSFDYLLPIITAQAADPKAHPSLKAKMLELTARIGNVLPKDNVVAGGGNSFAIQIIFPKAEQQEQDDFRIIDGETE